MFEVREQAAICDFGDLVSGEVSPLEIGGRWKVKNGGECIVACIQFDKVLDCGEWLEGGQVVARHIHVLQIFVTLDAFERGQL